MTSDQITPEQLQANGAACSLCGQTFNPQNIPLITKTDKKYHNRPVYTAICKNGPYNDVHNEYMIFTVLYQATVTGSGIIAIMAKDLDLDSSAAA